jgi:probable HAF family extracellular repeat protein
LETRNLLSHFITVSYPGALQTFLNGINDHGQIIGNYLDGKTDLEHAFLYQNGEFTPFDFPGSLYTIVNGINNEGQIVGVYVTDSVSHPVSHPFVYDHGVFTPFPKPADAQFLFLSAINDQGDVVGYYFTTNFDLRAFIFSNGSLTTIDSPDNTPIFPTGINDSGDITLQISSRFGFFGLVYSHGASTLINNTIGGPPTTFVNGINNRGQFVGDFVEYSFGVGRAFHGFVESLTPPSFTTFDVPGGFARFPTTIPEGINDSGEIVGYYATNPNDEPAGFIADLDPPQSSAPASAADLSNTASAQQTVSGLTAQSVNVVTMNGSAGTALNTPASASSAVTGPSNTNDNPGQGLSAVVATSATKSASTLLAGASDPKNIQDDFTLAQYLSV